MRWAQESPKPSRLWSDFTLEWTTPGGRHELAIVPQQGTATDPREVWEFIARAACHVIIDQLPPRAYFELLETLADMRDFYAAPLPSADHPMLGEAKPLKKLGRTTRAEVTLPDD